MKLRVKLNAELRKDFKELSEQLNVRTKSNLINIVNNLKFERSKFITFILCEFYCDENFAISFINNLAKMKNAKRQELINKLTDPCFINDRIDAEETEYDTCVLHGLHIDEDGIEDDSFYITRARELVTEVINYKLAA